jgi:S1-C subfamily serine protease
LATYAVSLLVILCALIAFRPSLARAQNPANSNSLEDLGDLETRFKSVADKVSPAVVAISASSQPDDSPAACRSQEMSSDKLQAFLSKTTRMVGTGFLIDSSGYILTNDHVIDDAEQLWITMDDRKVYPAIVVGSDPRSDLAVLKIPGNNFPTVHLGDGSAVHRGQWSIAMGNPYGLSGEGGMCLSVGVVSAVNRSLPKLSDSENRLYVDLIQTTAQINPGNSGGPLFDLHGDVIGINAAVIMPQKAVNGIGFAMPITQHLLKVVDALKQGREVVYGYLGVVVSNPSDRDRELAGENQPVGVHVDSIQSDSPADGGAIRCGDLITAIGGHAIPDSDSFVQVVGTSDIAQPVNVELMRSGKPIKVQIRLRKRQLPVAAVTRDTQRLRWAGMLVGISSIDNRSRDLTVLEIEPGSLFARRGIHEGSILRSVAGKPVTGIVDLQEIINSTPIEQCHLVTEPGPPPPTFTADLPLGP